VEKCYFCSIGEEKRHSMCGQSSRLARKRNGNKGSGESNWIGDSGKYIMLYIDRLRYMEERGVFVVLDL